MIRLRVPGSLSYRTVALRVVSEACRMAQGREADAGSGETSDEFEAQAVSAFAEAFNNIAIHGFRGLAPGNVDIEISWSAEEIIIQMTDGGHSFDPDTVEPPALDELPEGGMGIFIMRSFMDAVEYTAGPPNVLRMVKRRSTEDAPGPDDVPFSSDAPKPPPDDPTSSCRSDWGFNAVDDAPRIEARVVGGSRRT